MRAPKLMALFALLLIAAPLPLSALPSGPIGGASATFPGEVSNSTFEIASPAFVYFSFYWTDGLQRKEVLDLDQLIVIISGDGHPTRRAVSNPSPVEPSSSVRLSVYPNNVGSNGYILWDKNYTSGVAGSWYTAYVIFNMQAIFNSTYFPVEIKFRPYDANTGAGLPVEQFNITAQFADECGACTSGYLANNETPIGAGSLNTYFGFPITVRVRDYFGNLLYNQTRTIGMDNNFCVPEKGAFDPGVIPCGLKSDQFYAWDIPLSVYSMKFYNQKPDQFVKINLHWNGTGSGEEIFSPSGGLFPPWWNSGYTYREPLKVQTSTTVPTDFDLSMNLTASTLGSKLQADYRDLRVLYWNGSWTELNRSYDGTTLRFKAVGPQPMPDSPANASWHFDEGTGTTALDSSGNGGTGTLTNGPTWITDRNGTGYAVNFDGSNDFITVPDSSALDITTSAITIEAWIKPSSSTNNFQILSKATGVGSTARKYGMYLATGSHLGFEVRTTSGTVDLADTSVISTTTWTHVAGTYDGSTMRWYVNGIETKNTAQTGTIVSTPGQALRIGSFTTGVSFFIGAIGDVRIYNYSRTAAQIACDSRLSAVAVSPGCVAINASTTDRSYYIYYGNSLAQAAPTYSTYQAQVLATSGITAYWPMNESSGTTFADIQAPATNGAWLGGSATPTVINAVIQGGRFFDGSNDAGSATIDLSSFGAVNLEFNFRMDETPGTDMELIEYTTNFNTQTWGFNFYYDNTNGGLGVYLRGTAGYNGKIYALPTVGVWHHMLLTFDKSQPASDEITAYLDGALWTVKTIVGGHSNNNPVEAWANSVLYIGARAASSTFAKFNLDELALYSTTPSAATIAAHARATVGQNGSTVANVSLDSDEGFAWYQSPGETVERFLNPGYYSTRIATVDTSGTVSVTTVGINVTGPNFYMIAGLNITHFVGDFNTISNQQIQIASALRPDIIAIGTLLPRTPSELTSPNPGDFMLIHPFSILEGTVGYTTPTSSTNATAFAPNLSSVSGDGSLLTTIIVSKDQYVFSGSATAHVWINATNGTTLWENSTLPPMVTLPGYSGDVYVVSNQSIQATRISDFRAIWEFSFRYYPSYKRYEQSLTLNNTGNRTVLNPKWFVGFPDPEDLDGRTINVSTAALLDLDNNVWLKAGQNFEVGTSGYYMAFDQLNASSGRAFFFTFYDQNSTGQLSTQILQITEVIPSTAPGGESGYWKGSATFANGFGQAYSSDLIIRLVCSPQCENVDLKTVQVVDRIAGRTLSPNEFFQSEQGILIVGSAVGSVPGGASKSYDVYFKVKDTPTSTSWCCFVPILPNVLGPISFFHILIILTVASLIGGVLVTGKGKRADDWRSFWTAGFFVFAMTALLLFIGHGQGWVL